MCQRPNVAKREMNTNISTAAIRQLEIRLMVFQVSAAPICVKR